MSQSPSQSVPEHPEITSRVGRHPALDRRQFPRDVRFLPVRVLRHLHRQGVLPDRERGQRLAAHVHDVLARRPDAAGRRDRARRLYRPDRPPQGLDRDARHHGAGHGLHRGHPDLWHHRHRGADHRADRPAAAGLLRRRRARRRVDLSVRDRHPGQQGLLHRVPVGEPAGRDLRRGDHRLRHECQPDVAADRRRRLAHPVLHRLPDRSVHLRAAPLAAGDAGVPVAEEASDLGRRFSPRWRRTGRSCCSACCWWCSPR